MTDGERYALGPTRGARIDRLESRLNGRARGLYG
jgi:hypothetical protein